MVDLARFEIMITHFDVLEDIPDTSFALIQGQLNELDRLVSKNR